MKRKNFMLTPHFSYEEMTRSQWAEEHGVSNEPDELQLLGLFNLCQKLGEPLREMLLFVYGLQFTVYSSLATE